MAVLGEAGAIILMEKHTGRTHLNISTDFIYSDLANLFECLWQHKLTIMVTLLTDIPNSLNYNNFPILQPILMKLAAKKSMHKGLYIKASNIKAMFM